MTENHPNGGFALAATVFALVVLGALVTGGFYIGRQDQNRRGVRASNGRFLHGGKRRQRGHVRMGYGYLWRPRALGVGHRVPNVGRRGLVCDSHSNDQSPFLPFFRGRTGPRGRSLRCGQAERGDDSTPKHH